MKDNIDDCLKTWELLNDMYRQQEQMAEVAKRLNKKDTLPEFETVSIKVTLTRVH